MTFTWNTALWVSCICCWTSLHMIISLALLKGIMDLQAEAEHIDARDDLLAPFKVHRYSRKLWAALLAEFIGLAIFQIYGGSANDDVAALANGITLTVLGENFVTFKLLNHNCFDIRSGCTDLLVSRLWQDALRLSCSIFIFWVSIPDMSSQKLKTVGEWYRSNARNCLNYV